MTHGRIHRRLCLQQKGRLYISFFLGEEEKFRSHSYKHVQRTSFYTNVDYALIIIIAIDFKRDRNGKSRGCAPLKMNAATLLSKYKNASIREALKKRF